MDYPRYCPLRSICKDIPMSSFQDSLPLYAFRDYYRPWYKRSVAKDFGSTIENGKDTFKIILDVQHFQVDEISVKVNDTEIIVEGKHEEKKEDCGFVSRQFKRRYPLPDKCSPENVTSTLSSDGVLTVIAEKRLYKSDEKIVPIKFWGTCPKKAECRATGITQKDIDDAIREANELISRDKTKIITNDHSHLLKSEILKEAVSRKDKETDSLNISSEQTDSAFGESSVKPEETIGRSSVGMLQEQLSHASTSEMSALKTVTESVKKETSSFKSSMSSTSASEYMSAELKDAAENI